MNIAFEISPLITASGTFGDKSGVYRYTIGLLGALIAEIQKNYPDSKLFVFTFSKDHLHKPLNEDMRKILNKHNIEFIGHNKELSNKYPKKRFFSKFPSLPALHFSFIPFRSYYNRLRSKIEFSKYISCIEFALLKRNVTVVFHSETGFYPLRNNVKNVITIFDLTSQLFPSFHKKETIDLQNRKLHFALHYCDGIVVISETTRKDLQKFMGKHKTQTILGYPGTDDNLLKDTETLKWESLMKIVNTSQLGLHPKKYLLYCGTYEPRKNITKAVRAFGDLIKEKKLPQDFKLVLIGGNGWGGVKSQIKEYIQNNKINSIIMMDFVEDRYLKTFIYHSYNLIFPSLYEGFGLPVLEGMAAGIPVITSNTSAMPEVGGEAVLYVNPQNVDDIKGKIQYLVNHREKAVELSIKGRERAKKFAWSNTAKSIYDFLEKP